MRTDLKTLTIENLKAAKACEEGMEWITPIIESAPDTAADRLCAEHPLWHQWAIENGFDVPVSPEVWDRMGCQIVDGALRHTQTAGDWSTQTAGAGSRHKAGLNSAFVCRYWEDGDWRVAVTVNPDPDYYWTFGIEKQEWVHAEDQSTLGGAA